MTDSANIQYVSYGSANSGQTVLRINVGGDDITSGSQENINLQEIIDMNVDGVISDNPKEMIDYIKNK